MVRSDGQASPVARRAFLGSVAGLPTLGAPTVAAASEDTTDDLRVMTRNLYVGVDLFELAVADDLDDVRRIAGGLLEDARDHPYEARAEALAGEVAATRPDVVGVQEAVLVRTREPSEFDGDHDPGASDVLVDLLELVREALAARGLAYGVAASTVTNDVEVPAETEDGDVDVRLTDRVAVFVREGVAVEETRTDRFEADVAVPLAETDLAIERGFCSVDVTLEDETATVATAHLEAIDPTVRGEQAAELLERLPVDRPVVLAGDVNSGPGGPTGAYNRLLTEFDDPVETLRPGADAYTCCFAPDLRGDGDALDRRVDVVLYRGGIEPTAVERVGVDADTRATADAGEESVRLWPSDHAGVVATFAFDAATAAAGEGPSIPTPTEPGPDPAEEQPEPQSGPGFLLTAVGAAVAALVRWRSSD